MGDLLACSICFATDVNLYNMYKYRLKTVFEDLTGIRMSVLDNYPHYLCAYCQHLLLKCTKFKEKCLKSLQVLKRVSLQVPVLTLEHIHSLSLTSSSPHCLSISTLPIFSIDVPPLSPTDTKIKEENDSDINLKEQTDDSDEEPLAKKVMKKKENRIAKAEFEFGEETTDKSFDYPEFDNDNFDRDKEDACSDFEYDDAFGNADFEPVSNGVDEISKHDLEILILSKEVQIKEILARKESRNYQNSFYKCELCFKGFTTDATLKNHMVRHDPSSGEHICDVCHTRWPELRSLKAHQIASHERKYICRLCSHTSRSLNGAKEHIRFHRGHTYVCKMCGASFLKSTSYLTHVRMQHPSKFACDMCGESFIGQMGLNMHKKKTHEQCKGTKRRIFCVRCCTRFKNIEALKRHASGFEDGVCDTNLRSCTYCGENFTTTELLKEHEKSHLVFFRCDTCNRNFASERSLAVHYHRVHLGIKPKEDRPQPRRVPGMCEICGKKCNSTATLIHHQRIHTGEKPYKCNECPKSFSVLQRLQIHIRTHTGEAPFKCTHCPKAFKHKAALNRHNRVHTGVKPYQCPNCSKSFSQSNSMKLHVRTVHLKLPAPYRNRKSKNTE